MPIYEYQCGLCGHQLDMLQKITDEPLKECPACHQPSLNKLVSAAGLQFKGTGWYVTDYSDKGKSKSSAGKEEAKSDTKTAENASADKPSTDKSSGEKT